MSQPGIEPHESHRARLAYGLFRLNQILEVRLNSILSSHSLTARQFSALLHIAEDPDLTRLTLAHALQITPQAAGALARRLDERGLITRTAADPWNPMTYALTRLGRRALSTLTPMADCAARDSVIAVFGEFREQDRLDGVIGRPSTSPFRTLTEEHPAPDPVGDAIFGRFSPR